MPPIRYIWHVGNYQDLAVLCQEGDTRPASSFGGPCFLGPSNYDRRRMPTLLSHEGDITTPFVLSDEAIAAGFSVVTGIYYPAVSIDGLQRYELVSTTPHETPHQAALAALEICANAPRLIDGEREWFPSCISAMNGLPAHSSMWGFIPEYKNAKLELSYKTRSQPVVLTKCQVCGFPGHNRKTCPRPKSYNKIGIEIEGRWYDYMRLKNRVHSIMGATIAGDGSIWGGLGNSEAVEVRTRPDTVTDVLRQLLDLYPDESDASCGMHVHVSFNDTTHISQLLCPLFYAYFIDRWTKWGQSRGLSTDGQFFRRLRGHNDFCQRNRTWSDEALRTDRYTHLNFSSWSAHGTLECRLLPMFRDSSLAVGAVVELLSIYEDWLAGVADTARPPIEGLSTDINEFATSTQTSTEGVEIEFNSDTHRGGGDVPVLDLPPVAPGYTRVVVTPDMEPTLRALGISRAA